MTIKQAYLAIIALSLLVSICFVPFVQSNESSPASEPTIAISPLQTTEEFENISVSILSPIHNATISNDYNCSFIFKPAINGTGNFLGASLMVNGTVVATNQTALTAYENNTISYKFPSNGTYIWNIGVQNISNVVWAPQDFNLTVAVPDKIAVDLVSPTNGSTISNDYNCSFVFVPSVNGTDKFTSASLLINGSVVASNQTAIVAGENNTIYYKFTSNGTYNWNIRLQSESFTVTAPSNYNFTVAVYVAPSATPTPTVTSTPTPTSTSSPAPTATPTSSPAPTEPAWFNTWLTVIIVVFIICAILVVVLILLKRKQQ
ncbi:MAG: hypothetical protein ACQCN4_00720 [Candidatus Bathyarchaeia archaeon]|jgi:hypothetical protein